jgi:hypothetical protein
LSAIEMKEIAEPFIPRRALRHLKRAASSSSRREPATHSSPPTRQPCFAPRNWRRGHLQSDGR